VFWVNLYWSLLVLLFGACVGSFLNVVIYRWPRDISLRRPLRSFCPSCRSTLQWRDNLPVLSYVLLRGRCRYCRAPISVQYPLVELATAFTFLILFDAFFVARLRDGISDLTCDWPILLAHWALAGGLIVVTVMDLEAYLVDIRVTWIMTGLGLILHAMWTPAASTAAEGWIRPGAIQAVAALAAAVGMAIGALIWLRGSKAEGEDVSGLPAPAGPPSADTASVETGASAEAPAASACESAAVESQTSAELLVAGESLVSRPASYAWIWAVVGLIVVAAYVGSMVLQDYHAWTRLIHPPRDAGGRLVWPEASRVDPGLVRTGVGLAVLFVVLTVFASHPHPEEDEGIVEAINAEAVTARRNALWELLLLSPAILLIVAGLFIVGGNPAASQAVERVLHWKVFGNWQPLWGLATALTGWAIGGALAWATRIFGTLGLGKEAFGMGDVHIMAAIGAIAGWSVAFIGFFAASLLALVGMVVILCRRQGRALPYGPWLALASFIVVIYHDRILDYLQIMNSPQ